MAAEGAWSWYFTRNGRIEAHVYIIDFEYCNVSNNSFHILAIETGDSTASSHFPRLSIGKRYVSVIVMAAPGAAPRTLVTGMSSRARLLTPPHFNCSNL